MLEYPQIDPVALSSRPPQGALVRPCLPGRFCLRLVAGCPPFRAARHGDCPQPGGRHNLLFRPGRGAGGPHRLHPVLRPGHAGERPAVAVQGVGGRHVIPRRAGRGAARQLAVRPQKPHQLRGFAGFCCPPGADRPGPLGGWAISSGRSCGAVSAVCLWAHDIPQ